ncbi:MAG: thiamine biosynthesis protein ApbE [Planctomycetaceae bacterium]|nr:thiamine biosynthesis protein ApbE [Planctomycetaceae bacterium]
MIRKHVIAFKRRKFAVEVRIPRQLHLVGNMRRIIQSRVCLWLTSFLLSATVGFSSERPCENESGPASKNAKGDQNKQPLVELSRFEFTEVHMGTQFKLTVYAEKKSIANKAAASAYARIKELNSILSDYDPESELMSLCRNSQPDQPVKVSKELFTVLKESQRISKLSAGAFDVSVGPVVKLWRRSRRQKKLPMDERLAEARGLVDYRKIQLDEDSQTVELMKPGMRLDLGGIAKGYAGDEALSVLRKHGIRSALIDAGGDIVAGDPPPGSSAWQISIEAADSNKKATRNIYLANAAVATSGDAYQYVEINGTRYSHIVDPHTGLGLTDRSSVTVIAKTGMEADALASTVSVLGPTKAVMWASFPGIPRVSALIVAMRDGLPKHVTTGAFAQYFDRPGSKDTRKDLNKLYGKGRRLKQR